MDAFSTFKPLRNKLKQFSFESILSLSVQKLHELRNFPVQEVAKYPPWFLLLLIKWSVFHSDPGYRRHCHASPGDFDKLVNLVHKLFGEVRLPSQYSNSSIFLKNTAFQQLLFQIPLSSSDIGRQILLFDHLPTKPIVKDLFFECTGFAISDFLKLATILVGHFLTSNDINISSAYFAPLGIAPEVVVRFLDTLSLDMSELKPFFEAEERRFQNFESTLYAQTPLKQRPLLRFRDKDRYVCYSPNVLFHTVSTLVYDKLKDHSADSFSPEFGQIFERYIRTGLEYAGLSFSDEKQLQRKYINSLVVDFVVSSEGGNVLIESKAIELSPLARVAPDAAVISNALRDSITKAIKQAVTVASRLAGGGSRESFLLVVTFKDLYIGNGKSFLEQTPAGKEIEEFINDNHFDVDCLPFENIYFLSPREFEWLMYLVKEHKLTPEEIIRKVIEEERRDKKLQFGQHLRSVFPAMLGAPSFVKTPCDVLFAQVEQVLSEKKQDAALKN